LFFNLNSNIYFINSIFQLPILCTLHSILLKFRNSINHFVALIENQEYLNDFKLS
jgi:hypothetical protein